MKYFLFIVTLCFAIPTATASQMSIIHNAMLDGNPVIEGITRALNAGDVASLSQYFGAKVQVSVGDEEQTYEKAKATEAIKSFFSSKRPSGYAPMHSGKSKENADQYMIGNLTTESGTYRVYIYLKTSGTSQTIQEIRFDQ
jgi:Domain of unknown function (DUF4783)